MDENNDGIDENSQNLSKEGNNDTIDLSESISDHNYDDGSGGFMSSYMPVIRVKATRFKRPIIIALVFSGLLAWFAAQTGIQDYIPSETPSSGFFVGMLFTVIAGISSVFIYMIVKKRGEIALKYLMGGAFLILTFLLLYFFGELILGQFLFHNPLLADIISALYLLLCGIVTIVLIYKFFSDKMSLKLKNLYVLMVGILIGAFMGVVIHIWVAIPLLVGISIWDIISVKKGPIKKIMELTGKVEDVTDINVAEEELSGESDYFEFAELDIGIGDVAFYSMLTSITLVTMADLTMVLTENTFLSFGIALAVALITGIGILIGANLTINALKKNRILPGLPLSIFIGMGFAFISGFLGYTILNIMINNGFFTIP